MGYLCLDDLRSSRHDVTCRQLYALYHRLKHDVVARLRMYIRPIHTITISHHALRLAIDSHFHGKAQDIITLLAVGIGPGGRDVGQEGRIAIGQTIKHHDR